MGLTLTALDDALRAAWSAETTFATPEYLARAADRPSRGQCGPTALVVHDYFGGQLLLSEVSVAGVVDGVHYWNRLPSGADVDLTGDQFLSDELVLPPRAVDRRPLATAPAGAVAAYVLLRNRVQAAIGPARRQRRAPNRHCRPSDALQ